MKNYFEKQFELRYFEMNEFGEASPTTMLMLLEETAADHCHSINYSLYDLVAQNVGWVLLSGVMQMERYPKYKEKITIKTWLSSYSMIKGFRENIIYDEQGEIIGRSRGLWVFFDIAKRRPIQIFDAIKEGWSSDSTLSIDHNISKKIEVLDVATFSKKFKVNRFDTDMNEHVNNIRYLQWLMESLPKDIVDNYCLIKIDGRFITEALFDDTIISLTKGDVEHSFIHSIKIQGSNKVCATAQTFWRKRG
ncbi:MAG: acyl-ACP thioesterase [Flavobacteriaceae bacterium]|nr:MAG: acyl-ACP thioesterase [Flavobacteriaceae bacterium]